MKRESEMETGTEKSKGKTISASYQMVTTTPPRPPAAEKVMRSPSVGEGGLNLKEESPSTNFLLLNFGNFSLQLYKLIQSYPLFSW